MVHRQKGLRCRPSLTILWLALPFIWLGGVSFVHDTIPRNETYQANPTPQASFSNDGSYRPLKQVSTYFWKRRDQGREEDNSLLHRQGAGP